jgi:hypothetical protein
MSQVHASGEAHADSAGPSEVANAALAGEALIPVDSCRRTPGRRRGRQITLVVAVLGLAGYVAYERVGTRANADSITSFESLVGGAVVVGMSDDEPGFIALSALDHHDLRVRADLLTNWLTGCRTVVHVETAHSNWRGRLRGPQVILVAADGAVEGVAADWTLEEFRTIAHAIDCAGSCRKHLHRCGQPLADVADTLAYWPAERVPAPVREFLTRMANDKSRTKAES